MRSSALFAVVVGAVGCETEAPPPGSLAGRVCSVVTGAVTEADVTVFDDAGVPVVSVVVDASGEFVVEDLEAGVYSLDIEVVNEPRRRAANIEVNDGARAVFADPACD